MSSKKQHKAVLIMASAAAGEGVRTQAASGWSRVYWSDGYTIDLELRDSRRGSVLEGQIVDDEGTPTGMRSPVMLVGDRPYVQTEIDNSGHFCVLVGEGGSYRLRLAFHDRIVEIDPLEIV